MRWLEKKYSSHVDFVNPQENSTIEFISIFKASEYSYGSIHVITRKNPQGNFLALLSLIPISKLADISKGVTGTHFIHFKEKINDDHIYISLFNILKEHDKTIDDDFRDQFCGYLGVKNFVTVEDEIFSIVNTGLIDQALQKALLIKTDKKFDIIWYLALYLHTLADPEDRTILHELYQAIDSNSPYYKEIHDRLFQSTDGTKASVDLNQLFKAYQAIAANTDNPHYKEANKKLFHLLETQQPSKEKEIAYLEEKFRYAYLSEMDQSIIDKIYDNLCGYSYRSEPVASGIKGDVDTLIKLATHIRKFTKKVEPLTSTLKTAHACQPALLIWQKPTIAPLQNPMISARPKAQRK